jgi:midasin (ATPase involved in ribosome maturation)
MKKFTFALFIYSALVCTIHAQEKKTIEKVATTTRVVTKEGSQVTVKETEEVRRTDGTIILIEKEGEDKYYRREDSDFKEKTEQTVNKNVNVDKVTIDEKNEALIQAEKKRQEDELQASIEEAKAKAAAQRKLLEQQKKERMEALEKNRQELEKRGKGIVKLRKKKNNH